jgi:hypothetical protein
MAWWIVAALFFLVFGAGVSVGLMWQAYSFKRDIEPELDAYDQNYKRSLAELAQRFEERGIGG